MPPIQRPAEDFLIGFATAAALAGLVSGYWLAQPLPDYPLRDPAVSSHVAALAPKRQLIEI